jgi:hypothetical protein
MMVFADIYQLFTARKDYSRMTLISILLAFALVIWVPEDTYGLAEISWP